jgi:hypothetical protein
MLLYASRGVFGIIFFYNPFLRGVLLTGLHCTGRVFVEKLTPLGILIPFLWVVYSLKKSKGGSMRSVVGKRICPLILIKYQIFPPLPRIIVCASIGVGMLEVNSSHFLLNRISSSIRRIERPWGWENKNQIFLLSSPFCNFLIIHSFHFFIEYFSIL